MSCEKKLFSLSPLFYTVEISCWNNPVTKIDGKTLEKVNPYIVDNTHIENLTAFFILQNSFTCSLPSVPIPDTCTLPPNRGLLVSVSAPPTPPSGDSSTVVTWFKAAWGLEITVEFFMFSAVVTGACLLVFPPNNLWKVRRRAQVKAEITEQRNVQ